MPPKSTKNRKPPTARQPGDVSDSMPGAAEGKHDPDAAIAAGQRGGTHKVTKARPPVPASKVKGDPERPPEAAVNAKREMKYEDAMKAHAAAVELAKLEGVQNPTAEQAKRMDELRKVALTRSVLTEQGWVAAPNKKMGQG